MKKTLKFFIYIILIIIICLAAGLFLTYDKNSTNNVNTKFSLNDVMSNINIRQLNKVTLSENNLEALINSYISTLNLQGITFTGTEVTVYDNNKASVRLYFKNSNINFPSSITMNLNFNYSSGLIKLTITKVKLGKLPIPMSLFKTYIRNNSAAISKAAPIITNIDPDTGSFTLDINKIINSKQNIFYIHDIYSGDDSIILEFTINFNSIIGDAILK